MVIYTLEMLGISTQFGQYPLGSKLIVVDFNTNWQPTGTSVPKFRRPYMSKICLKRKVCGDKRPKPEESLPKKTRREKIKKNTKKKKLKSGWTTWWDQRERRKNKRRKERKS
jgi:adenine specific DNA methylase Mod